MFPLTHNIVFVSIIWSLGWDVEECRYVPSQDGEDGVLFLCSAVNPAGLSGREQLMCWTCGVWVKEAVQPVIGPCCFSQGNVSGRAGLKRTSSPICSSNYPDWQIGVFARSSRGAIGEVGLHMQITWKWHKHVDTRIGFISAAGRKSQSRASFGHSRGILPHYIIWMMMPALVACQ